MCGVLFDAQDKFSHIFIHHALGVAYQLAKYTFYKVLIIYFPFVWFPFSLRTFASRIETQKTGKQEKKKMNIIFKNGMI